MKIRFGWLFLLILAIGCSKDITVIEDSLSSELTIFFVNDQHGQLDNFSKIKYIVEQEEQKTNVLIACSGDIFSGNPIVDNYPEKGFPIIDVMNKVGFDISVLGNHEFDYGEIVLKERMGQAQFDWVCANVDMGSSGVPQPLEFKTIEVGGLKITFLGLIETSGKQNPLTPLTHPGKVKNIVFIRPETVVSKYSSLKAQEDADLLVALTHLGHSGFNGFLGDFQLAEQFPFIDLIIGGHSNELLDEVKSGVPIFQAGNRLEYLGKIRLSINERRVETVNYELIDLNAYPNFDSELKSVIDDYNSSMPELDDVIGYSHNFHERSLVGCFYADALRGQLNTDVSFQNSGGVRSVLDEGEISKREIYEIDPFNNGTIVYTMTVEEIKTFLKESHGGYYYSGIHIEQMGDRVMIMDTTGSIIPDNTTTLSVGINDFIPAVHDNYFPESGMTTTLTTAETIISYLESGNSQVDYPQCSRFFKYK